MKETIAAALSRGAALLDAAGVEAPAREARLLLSHALGVSPPLDRTAVADVEKYDALLARRAAREPFAFITGRQGFWTLDLAVSPATLIPRPDSETLIEALRDHYVGREPPRTILDLGAGTGALLLAALTLFPRAWGVGVDRAPEAARLASSNAQANGLGLRAAFLAGDWAAPLAGHFDAVLCNPPYIRTSDIFRLMPEVGRHEPRGALDGGDDGLEAYRRVLPMLSRLLSPRGVAVFELGDGQYEQVSGLAADIGFSVAARRDLAGNQRAIMIGAGKQEK